MAKSKKTEITSEQFQTAYDNWISADIVAFEKRDNFAQLVRKAYLNGNLERLINEIARKIPKGSEGSLRRLVADQTSDENGKNPEFSIGMSPKVDGEFSGYELKPNNAQSSPKGSKIKTVISKLEAFGKTLDNLKTGEDHAGRLAEIRGHSELIAQLLGEIEALETGVTETQLAVSMPTAKCGTEAPEIHAQQ